MTVIEVALTLSYPDGMDVDPVRVALANLAEALDRGAWADVALLDVSVMQRDRL